MSRILSVCAKQKKTLDRFAEYMTDDLPRLRFPDIEQNASTRCIRRTK